MATPSTYPRTYKVKKEDHIWGIARGLLPEGASNAEIWDAVRELHEANSNVSPTQLTVSGQQLEIPESLRDRYSS